MAGFPLPRGSIIWTTAQPGRASLRGSTGFRRGCAETGKLFRGGIYELRIDHGPGYRVYYAQDGAKLILLLCAGTKRTQTKDIEKAREYWKEYENRSAWYRVSRCRLPT